MKLSVGCNWDDRLLDELAPIPEVVDLCGFLLGTVVGAGSPAWLAPGVTRERFVEFLNKAHKAGKTVTVILDAPNMEATEWEPETHKKVLELFGWLQEVGCDYVELAIPYLVELVHRRFPKLGIRVSPITRAALLDTVVFLHEMGADMVGLEPMIQRDLSAIRVIARDSPVPLFLEPTNGILRGSPSYGNFDFAWTNSLLTSSRFQPDAYSEYARTYNIAFDDCYKIEHPVEILRCDFIRPEDIARYEECGVENFKLDVAWYTTDDIVARVKAYVARRYDGDLTRLVNLLYFGHDYAKEAGRGYVKPALPEGPPPEVTAFFDLMADKQFARDMIKVDNRGLDGYLDHIASGGCDPIRCPTCEEYAARVISLDKQRAEYFVRTLKEYRRVLSTGRFE